VGASITAIPSANKGWKRLGRRQQLPATLDHRYQAKVTVAARRRRRDAAPIRPKPPIIIAQVAGSGTPGAKVAKPSEMASVPVHDGHVVSGDEIVPAT
jgi:hypothetical protein